MPELHQVINAVLEGSRKQGEKLEKTLEELKREKEESERVKQLSVAEQVAEAKDNNPDLVHWESNDPEAWDEALKQDEILRTNTPNGPTSLTRNGSMKSSAACSAIMPEASAPEKQPTRRKIESRCESKA